MDGTNWQNVDAKGIWRPFADRWPARDQLWRAWATVTGSKIPVYASTVGQRAFVRQRPALLDRRW